MRPLDEIPIVYIVAMARNGVIGREGGLPWRLSSDLKRFKALTMGKPVIMGRRTFDSIGKPLPGRDNIVVSHQSGLAIDGATVVGSPEEAMELAREKAAARGADEIAVIGGGELFGRLLDQASLLYVTHVEAEPEGDTFFPGIKALEWESIHEESVPAGERDSAPTRFTIYRRKPS